MRCGVFQGKVEALLSAGCPLPPQFAAHAARCPRCADDWQLALRSQVLLSSLHDECQPDAGFFERLMSAVEQEKAAPRKGAGRARRWLAAAGLKPARTPRLLRNLG